MHQKAWRTDGRTDGRTGGRTDGRTDEQPRSNMPLQLLWSWGHNKWNIISAEEELSLHLHVTIFKAKMQLVLMQRQFYLAFFTNTASEGNMAMHMDKVTRKNLYQVNMETVDAPISLYLMTIPRAFAIHCCILLCPMNNKLIWAFILHSCSIDIFS